MFAFNKGTPAKGLQEERELETKTPVFYLELNQEVSRGRSVECGSTGREPDSRAVLPNVSSRTVQRCARYERSTKCAKFCFNSI